MSGNVLVHVNLPLENVEKVSITKLRFLPNFALLEIGINVPKEDLSKQMGELLCGEGLRMARERMQVLPTDLFTCLFYDI